MEERKATLSPEEPRSHREEVGGGSTYVVKERPARKRDVGRENGGWLL